MNTLGIGILLLLGAFIIVGLLTGVFEVKERTKKLKQPVKRVLKTVRALVVPRGKRK